MVLLRLFLSFPDSLSLSYRGRDLKTQHDQKVQEREMQRITLPLSAFTNQACELLDENTIVVHTNQTPVEELQEGDAPLVGQARTPGA